MITYQDQDSDGYNMAPYRRQIISAKNRIQSSQNKVGNTFPNTTFGNGFLALSLWDQINKYMDLAVRHLM